MEFPVYLIIIVGCALLVLWCNQNSGRKPGTPVTGLFAYRDAEEQVSTTTRPADSPAAKRWTGAR
jgi:hypothetical protein